jgi:hypothetical protein
MCIGQDRDQWILGGALAISSLTGAKLNFARPLLNGVTTPNGFPDTQSSPPCHMADSADWPAEIK